MLPPHLVLNLVWWVEVVDFADLLLDLGLGLLQYLPLALDILEPEVLLEHIVNLFIRWLGNLRQTDGKLLLLLLLLLDVVLAAILLTFGGV